MAALGEEVDFNRNALCIKGGSVSEAVAII
jgi:hypothetical protein